MDTSEGNQNEPSPTEEPFQIPPKRLTCRDQTQDPSTKSLRKHTPLKVVIRGLPICTNKADIAAALNPEKFKILDIAQLTRGGLSNPSHCFSSKLPTHWLVAKSYSYHSYTVSGSPWEKYRGRNVIPQCQRCYGFYHSSENCFLKIHCGVCAGPPTKECNLKPDAERKCINCQEAMQPSKRMPEFPKEESSTTKMDTTKMDPTNPPC
ncbi:hypothetical protein CEXT_627991 [Caerostris extrusa]|uniref:Gag-like protein n=1 Tax=Caerostris extrusa TaxID=172846 RepID=A0AAV4WE16_CAEEX|nr:hypothetical protein CEXT_627991 [Caerostris extrusa]